MPCRCSKWNTWASSKRHTPPRYFNSALWCCALRLVLFDLDNTLLAGDSDYEWGQFLIERGVVDREHHEARNHAFYEDYKAGRLDIYAFLNFSLRPLATHTLAQLDA